MVLAGSELLRASRRRSVRLRLLVLVGIPLLAVFAYAALARLAGVTPTRPALSPDVRQLVPVEPSRTPSPRRSRERPTPSPSASAAGDPAAAGVGMLL